MAVATNVQEFNRAVEEFTTTILPEQFILFHKKIALEALSRIVFKTPVGNPELWQRPPPKNYVGGRARGNWQLTIDTYSDDEAANVDSAGGSTISEGVGHLAGLGFGQVVFLTNNVPYIVRLEEGWSTQAPTGMVGLTFGELATMFGGM